MSSVPTVAPNHVCKWYLAIFSFADQHRRKQATTAKRKFSPVVRYYYYIEVFAIRKSFLIDCKIGNPF